MKDVYPRIAVFAGEHSGDIYASKLIHALQSKYTDVHVEGFAGPLAAAAGLHTWTDCQPTSIMGFTGVIRHFFHYRRILQKIQHKLSTHAPDLIILIDYAGLNLRIASIAHQCNIKVLYYVPPKVWAWGSGRLATLKKTVTAVAPLYRFEHDFFQSHHIASQLVSHPFLTACATQPPANHPHTIGILPGSRPQEIRSLLPILLATCYQLMQDSPQLQFKLFCAESTLQTMIDNIVRPWLSQLPLQLIQTAHSQHLQTCYAAMVCSGTASFECGMLGVPMVVVYRCNWLNYLLIKCLVKVKWASLPNLMLHRAAIPELLQSQCHPQRIAQIFSELLYDSPARQAQCAALKQLQALVKDHSDSSPIEDIVTRLLNHA